MSDQVLITEQPNTVTVTDSGATVTSVGLQGPAGPAGSSTAATPTALGGVQLTGDLGGTSGTSPEVVSTHLSSALPTSQGGTGSSTQNFAAVFNVKGYGATGDGSTDDTTAFNAANTAATAANGLIYVPHGTYVLNATNLNAITASMLGESMNGTTLKLVDSFDATQNLIRIVSVSDIWIKNFTIDGNKSTVVGGTQYGLYISTTTNCGAENILTQNWTGVGTHFYNNTRAFATNLYSTANTYHGFEFEQNSEGTYTGIHGYSNTLHGVLVSPGEVSGTGSHGNTFNNIECDGNSQYGLAMNAANGNVSAFLSEGDVFNNVSLQNNSQYGLSIYMQNYQTFNGLYIHNNGYFGIYLFESAYNTFSNIFLHNNSQATNGGYEEIYLEGYSTSTSHPSSNNVFSGGQIVIDGTNKASYGIAEGTANDGNNSYTNINIPNAGTAGKYNVLATTSAIISDATGFAVAANSSLPSNQMGLDAPFGTATLRLYNPNSGGNFQFVTPNGSSEFWAGGNEVADATSAGLVVNTGYSLSTPTITGMTTPLSIGQGGTGQSTAAAAILALGGMDLVSAQTVGGDKTFTGTLGIGSGTDATISIPATYGLIINSGQTSNFRLLAYGTSIFFQNTLDAGSINFTGLNGQTLTGDIIFNTSGAVMAEANNTADLGTSSVYWSSLYATTLNLNSTASIDGTTAGQLNLNGNVSVPSTFLVNGKGITAYYFQSDFWGTNPGWYHDLSTWASAGITKLTMYSDSTAILTGTSGNITVTGRLISQASTTSAASWNIPQGVQPTSPNEGDFYRDATHFYLYLNATWNTIV